MSPKDWLQTTFQISSHFGDLTSTYYICTINAFLDVTKTVLFTPFCSREKALILIACQKIQFGLVWRCNAFKFSEAKLLNKS